MAALARPRRSDRCAGILITGAEEFGLVGAGCSPGSVPTRRSEFVNVDTVDHEGKLYW